MFIKIVLAITIFAMLILIELYTSKELIYRNNPCDFSYNKKLILFTFIFDDPIDNSKDIKYYSECIMYTNNSLTDDNIAKYLFEHRELYSKELNAVENNYKENHSSTIKMKQMEIKIENYENLFHIQ